MTFTDMKHTRQNLEERLTSLSDLRKRLVGFSEATLVCRGCFMVMYDYDQRSCICDSRDWTTIDVAIADLELALDACQLSQ